MRWPLAATLVGALVVILLVGGVVLARSRAAGELVAEQSVAAPRALTPAAATPPPTAIGTATEFATARPAAAAPTATVAPAQTAATTPLTSVPQPAATAPAVATRAPDASIVIDSSGTPQVFAAGTQPPQPTPSEWWNQSNSVSPELANELTSAFQHFWQVRAQALLDLNTAPLSGVMDGPLLQREVAGLDQMREQNQGEQIEVQHHMQIIHATETDATLVDNYTSHTVPVDLASNELGAPSPVGNWHLAYHFQKLGGTWKVVEAVQLQA